MVRRALALAGAGVLLAAVVGAWLSGTVAGSPFEGALGSEPFRVQIACLAGSLRVSYPQHGVGRSLPPGEAVPVPVPAATPARIEVLRLETSRSWWRELAGLQRPALQRSAGRVELPAGRPGEGRSHCGAFCPGGEPVCLALTPLAAPAVAERFDRWRADAPVAAREHDLDELMRLGETLYARRCAACHGSAGQGVQGMFPGLRGSPVVLGPLAPHVGIVAHGRPGTPMKAFRRELDDRELAALTTYQRNAFGHATGDVVQPWMIAALVPR